MTTANVSRRRFLKTTAVTGGGLVVGFSMSGCGRAPLPIDESAAGYVLNAFLQITPENEVRFYCPRDEMGQGVTTGLGTLVAEELDVEPMALDVVFAGVHADYANPDMGVQATGGSNSMKAHCLNTSQFQTWTSTQDQFKARSCVSVFQKILRWHGTGEFGQTSMSFQLHLRLTLKTSHGFCTHV